MVDQMMDLEWRFLENPVQMDSWKTTFMLAFQSLGVVYGDLSVSPLFVYKNTFAEGIKHSETNEEIYGVFSIIFWTLTLIPLVKYVFIVLKADDNGEGGTFALYSLICRHVKVRPNDQGGDDRAPGSGPSSSRLASLLEKHGVLQKCLLVLALIGACMVIGDGILTPTISVFSAVSGVELFMSQDHLKYVEVPVACLILIALFALQHYGTHRVGFLFAPVVLIWLISISTIGLYNIFHWNPYIFQAINPYYIVKFIKKTRREGWISLGAILLSITGSEAMFADLGHFSQLSIKLAFTFVVYPAVVLAYMGQAAYLSQNHVIENAYNIGFYVSVPDNFRWPVLVVAVLAAVVGSQAIITGTFSIIKQCSALDCFPRVKIIHTSSKIHGQIYIPEMNWTLMLLCLAVTIGFRDTRRMGNASGLAAITVMGVTTCLMALVIVLCWQRSAVWAICFFIFFGAIEGVFFTSSLVKFVEGAWVPIVLALAFLTVMYVWHYGTNKKIEFETQNRVSMDLLIRAGPTLGVVRVPGIGIIYTDLLIGVPPVLTHIATSLPAYHHVLIFLTIKFVPVPHVPPEQRFLIGRVGPREYRVYRCIVRYGYLDVHRDEIRFERDLIGSMSEYIRTTQEAPSNEERMTTIASASSDTSGSSGNVGSGSFPTEGMGISDDDGVSELREIRSPPPVLERRRVRFAVPDPEMNPQTEEMRTLMTAKGVGVIYIVGHPHMKATSGSGILKKVVIDCGYNFLSRNCRGPSLAFHVPHSATLEVGMFYQV